MTFNFLPGTMGRTIGLANSGISIGTEVGFTFDSRTGIIFGNILCNITMGITAVDITQRFLCNSLLTINALFPIVLILHPSFSFLIQILI
jgi:hypothetical protein